MRVKRILIAALVIFLIFFGRSSYPQTDIERGIGEIDRSMRKEAEKKMEAPPEKPPAIKISEEAPVEEGVKFFIRKIDLAGCETFPAEDFTLLLKEREGRDVSFGELKSLAAKIEREYLKKGVIASCVVPPQEIKDGLVSIRVVEARMGELNIQDHRYFDRKQLARYWHIRPGDTLWYYKISKYVQLMNKNADREVRATLHPGKKAGTTDVSLSVKSYFPVHAVFNFDREGLPSTGRYRKTFGGRHNNLLGVDDLLIAGYVYGDRFDSVYAFHAVPIGGYGTSIMYGFSRSESFPGKDFESYDLRSYSKDASLFAYQDIFNKDDYVGEVHAGLDGGDKLVYRNTGVYNKDRLRMLRIGGRFMLKGERSRTRVEPEFSQGLNILGARSSDLTSRGASNVFSKVKLTVEHKIALVSDISLGMEATALYGFEKLTPQEELVLGGIDSVRGYPYGDYYADRGILANVELLVPPSFLPDDIKLPYAQNPLKKDVVGVLFFDYGFGYRRGGRDGEKTSDVMASVGTGLRIQLFNQAYLRLEWGVPLKFADDPISESATVRLHMTFNFEDRFHREFDRINKLIKEKTAPIPVAR